MTLVLDASVVVASLRSRAVGLEIFGNRELLAPAFMWVEARSAVRGLSWRREIDPEFELEFLKNLDDVPVKPWTRKVRSEDVAGVARKFGWAKTYDAEYVHLAQTVGGTLVTLDMRLYRRVKDVVEVMTPNEVRS